MPAVTVNMGVGDLNNQRLKASNAVFPASDVGASSILASVFHAPEVECIGKGKASAPYEFGVKTSIVTTNARAPGGQFVLHTKTLPGNPYDGHTLRAVIEDTQKLIGREIERAYVDRSHGEVDPALCQSEVAATYSGDDHAKRS